ncbi:MAG: hypothetical protein P8Y71_23380 [Pseudolabrys sp.]
MIRRLTTRSCPICRVAMVHADEGWHCPQCGSAIIDSARSGRAPGEETEGPPARAVAAGTRRG